MPAKKKTAAKKNAKNEKTYSVGNSAKKMTKK